MLERSIDRITRIPALGPGFDGERHKAALVIAPGDLSTTDPFFLMADDNITEAGSFGDSHPHAGLETVTFMLNGTMEDTGGRLEEGDVEWMTAGSGIVHAENSTVSTGMRLFQLWLILPEAQRNMPPRVQILRRAEMPVHTEPGVLATVYSGKSGNAAAPTLNAVPVTLIDIRLEPGATFAPHLPGSYNAFVVGINGEVEVGATAEILAKDTVGWTGPMGDGDSLLRLRAGDNGARLLLYAGQPQNISVVAKGPFIAGSDEEMAGYYSAYRQGKFPHAGTMRPVPYSGDKSG
ncbi:MULTISPECIES: pirin family protein [unclassified Halomonas]|uniref:pirin family protein n=1 Tax=unclassified Halomonas TaxID=2609666 RepID=UPI000484A5FA|nr:MULTISPECIES: pirin family protein [unclassified Halomonas]NAO96996.1 pirin family protein [Halomonas sp. MG34]PKH59673.1 pirin family protein [Halomonas sp. Choline-3u-9]QGQ70443.1 pirin family protein [Halomonas sp. PA16-9]